MKLRNDSVDHLEVTLVAGPRNQIKARNINVLWAFIWLGVVNDLGSLRRRDELGANPERIARNYDLRVMRVN